MAHYFKIAISYALGDTAIGLADDDSFVDGFADIVDAPDAFEFDLIGNRRDFDFDDVDAS